MLTAKGPATWRVTGATDGPGFFVADEVATAMAAGVRVIGVTADGDVAAAVAAVAGADALVLTGDERNRLEEESVTRVRWLGAQLLIAMVVIGGFVAVFVVASTCALSAAQRRREVGLLRAVGATPGQVLRLMYAETLVVAVLGGAVGVPLGAVTAPLLAPPLVAAGLEPAGFTVTAQPAAPAAAFMLGVVVALAGAGAAARRSSRIPAMEALRDAAIDRRAMTAPRWIVGVLTAAGGGALMAALPALPLTTRTTAALGAAMLLLVAAALLAPVVIVPLVRVVTRPWRGSAVGMLVREGTLTGVRRVASTAAPVLLTVGFAALLTGTVATIEEAAGIDETARLPATLIAAPDGTPGLSAAAADRQPGSAELTTEILMTVGGRTSGYDATGKEDIEGIAALKLAGGGTSHVLRVTSAEALLAVAAGTVLGAAVAAAALLGMQHAVEAELNETSVRSWVVGGAVGWQQVRIVVPGAQSGLVALACAVVAVLAAAAPVLRARAAL